MIHSKFARLEPNTAMLIPRSLLTLEANHGVIAHYRGSNRSTGMFADTPSRSVSQKLNVTYLWQHAITARVVQKKIA